MTDPLLPTKTQWKRLQLSEAESLTAPTLAARKVEQLANTVEQIANALKVTIELLAKISAGLLDPATLALKSIIETAKSLLENLTGVGGEGVYQITIPVNPLDAYIPERVNYEATPGDDFTKKEAYASWKNLGRKGNAGSYGFLAKLEESLRDEDDLLRPRFDSSAYVAGMVMVFGSTSPAKMLQLIDKLAALFGSIPSPSALTESWREAFGPQLGFPRLENFRADLVPMAYIKVADGEPKASAAQENASSSIGVKLGWDPLLTRYYISALPSDQITGPVKWKVTGIVIHAFDSETKALENIGSQISLLKIFDGDFDFLQNTFLIEGLRPGTQTLGVRLYLKEVVGENQDGNEVFGLSTATDMQRVTITIPYDQQFFNRTGVPPNWTVLPSPLAMIPAVVRVVNQIILFLDNIEKLLESASDKIKKFVTELKRTIDSYVTWAKEIADTLVSMLEALKFPDIYAGYTTFYGQGGNALMLNQVGQALFSNDVKAPPFLNGTEPVLGFVLMAGSNSAGAITNFTKSMGLIFGTNFEEAVDSDFEATANAWSQAEASIDVLTEDVSRQISFTDGMIAEISTQTFANEPTLSAFGLDMQPSSEAVGCG